MTGKYRLFESLIELPFPRIIWNDVWYIDLQAAGLLPQILSCEALSKKRIRWILR